MHQSIEISWRRPQKPSMFTSIERKNVGTPRTIKDIVPVPVVLHWAPAKIFPERGPQPTKLPNFKQQNQPGSQTQPGTNLLHRVWG